jgi:hypothetical protein
MKSLLLLVKKFKGDEKTWENAYTGMEYDKIAGLIKKIGIKR